MTWEQFSQLFALLCIFTGVYIIWGLHALGTALLCWGFVRMLIGQFL